MTQTLTDEQLAAPDFEAADDRKLETASPRRGRKAIKGAAARGEASAEIVEAELAAAPAIAAIRANAVSMSRSELTQSLSLAQGFGMFQAFDLMTQFSGLARLKWLSERKQSEDYKGIAVTDRQGQSRTLNTFEDLCSYMGSSYRKIAEDLQNLAQFGESFMSTAEALGLGYRDLRLLRKGIAELPPEERQAILAEVESAEGPEEVKDRLAELRLELAQAQADKKKMAADIEAKDKTSKAKNEQIDSLAEQVNRLTSMAPDDQKKARDDANAKACADVDAQCQAVFVAVIQLCGTCAAIFTDERSSEDTCAWVHQRAGLLADSIANTMLNAGIDVDLRQYLEPRGESEAVETAEPEPAGNPG